MFQELPLRSATLVMPQSGRLGRHVSVFFLFFFFVLFFFFFLKKKNIFLRQGREVEFGSGRRERGGYPSFSPKPKLIGILHVFLPMAKL